MKFIPIFESENSRTKPITEEQYDLEVKKWQGVGVSIYRGIKNPPSSEHFVKIDAGGRVSANTANFYNLWINNHPDWSDFPKRGHICSTSQDYAEIYGVVCSVFPMKVDQKIGICTEHIDIWQAIEDSYKKLCSSKGLPFGPDSADSIVDSWHGWFEYSGMSDILSYSDLEEALLSLTVDSITKYNILYPLAAEFGFDGYALFEELFSPRALRCESKTYEEMAFYDLIENNEVWLDGEVLMKQL